MVIIQRAIKDRAPSGGRKKEHRGKRLYESGNEATLPRIAKRELTRSRMKGGKIKARHSTTNIANLYDPKTKTYSKTTIKIVTSNPANRHYVRRNILTQGTIIETDKGKARITNRPGQESSVNAILIS